MQTHIAEVNILMYKKSLRIWQSVALNTQGEKIAP